MANKEAPVEVKDYAGGWISERKGTPIPVFLKVVYLLWAVGTVSYLIVYMYGETTHSDRGPLVEQFNRATQTSESFMYMVAAMAALFFSLLIAFALKEPKGHDE
jgi:cytochrome c oxidase subunit IV